MMYMLVEDVFENDDVYFNAAKWLINDERKTGKKIQIGAFWLTDNLDTFISENNILVTVCPKDEIEINKNEPETKDGITLYWHQGVDVAAFEHEDKVIFLTRMLCY